jgi:anti-sigma regulatory factor (Ser/Thr protein kinase)
MRTAIFPANFDQLDSIRQFAAQAAMDAGLDNTTIAAVEMAMDEACSNIIEHAYDGVQSGEIECTCDKDAHDFTIVVRDHGQPFDVTGIPEPDLSAPLEDRPIGGLGIFLMRKLMDEVHYERLGESGNLLTMAKHIQQKK